MASTKLTRTMTGTAYPKKWTYSTWIKRSNVVDENYILYAVDSGGTNKTHVTFSAAGNFRIYNTLSSSTSNNLITNRVFRDPSAWYHIVIIWDTANGTPADRIRLYVNGVRETSFSTETLNDENGTINTAVEHQISGYATSSYIDGVMAHTHFCDNQTYDASYFGETDATSGIWIAKTSPSVTYGDNGFFLKYASGAHGTDSSGESNDFTTSGTLTNTQDNPDNNFCTINPLDDYYQESTYSNGNTKVVTESGSAVYAFNTATMGVNSGKWYWEVKYTNSTAGGAFFYGVAAEMATSASTELGQTVNQIGLLNNDTTRTNNTATAFGAGSYTTGDIMMCALDMTNSRIFFGKNGVWMTPSAGSGGGPTDGTGNVALPTAVASTPMGVYVPAFGPYVNASQTYEVNFGNGYFGTTLDGTNADDAGIGLFKYDVPAGYYALCTTNLGDQS